jgi:NAD(P)-dependent dehydrogenase (short-subunit alcohol dehydrogenase family)
MRLDNKIALITGGGKGIGASIAMAYAREGADLAICSRTESDLKPWLAKLKSSAGDASTNLPT